MIVRRVISGYPATALVTSDYCHAPNWSFENVIIAVSVDYIKAQEFRFERKWIFVARAGLDTFALLQFPAKKTTLPPLVAF